MECRAYGICLDSQSRGYLGKDRKVSSAAGGNLSRMHKTQETAKESRLNFMYSHLRNRTLVHAPVGSLVEEIDGTHLVLAKVSVRAELLILLRNHYPSRLSVAEALRCLSRRNPRTVKHVLRALHTDKLAHGNAKDGYHLTQIGYSSALAEIGKLAENP